MAPRYLLLEGLFLLSTVVVDSVQANGNTRGTREGTRPTNDLTDIYDSYYDQDIKDDVSHVDDNRPVARVRPPPLNTVQRKRHRQDFAHNGIVYYDALSSETKKFILGFINSGRRALKASNINFVVWSHALETLASEEASRFCSSTKNLISTSSVYKTIGKLIHTSPVLGDSSAFENALKFWLEGVHNYQSGLNACRVKNKNRCFQYLQLIWYGTSSVGCGYKRCEKYESGPYEGKPPAVICLLHPKINFPQSKPYLDGAPCSRCQTGSKCYAELCVGVKHPDFENYKIYGP